MGIQTPGSSMQHMQNRLPAHSSVGYADTQKQFPSKQHITGLSDNTQKEMNLDSPSIRLTANMGQNVNNVQPENICNTSSQEELLAVPPIIGLRDVSCIKSSFLVKLVDN